VPSLELKAVYSRSQKSAEALAKAAGLVDEAVYFDSPSIPDRSLDVLLKRADIEAVSIAVAIAKSPDLIRKALEAGKNVISEKPIAPTVESAKNLLEIYREQRQSKQLLWVVGENFRFWNSVNRAAKILRDLDGKLLTFRCSIAHFINADNKYFHSDW
jgi:predicted dehydrogenase